MTSLLPSVTATAIDAAFRPLATDEKGGKHDPNYQDQARGQRDLYTQIIVSSALGLSAFLTFCVRLPPTLESKHNVMDNMCWTTAC